MKTTIKIQLKADEVGKKKAAGYNGIFLTKHVMK
jgi:hypothetical protein